MSTPHSHLPIGKLAADRLSRGGSAGVCPDAEVLAAYVDGGLSEVEVAVVDGHLATCAACRSLLAALSPAESGAAAPPRVVPFRPRLDWKWLSAAATLVGAAVLWFALPRPEVLPTPPRVAERAVGDAVASSASAAADAQAPPDAAPKGATEADRVAAARPAPAAPPTEALVATQPAAEPPAPAAPAARPRDEASRGRRALADARPPAAAEPSPSTPVGSSRTEPTAASSSALAMQEERLRQATQAAREKEARLRRDRAAEESSEAKLATAANQESAPAAPEPAAVATTGRAASARAVPVAASRAVGETAAITTAIFSEPEGRLRWRIVGGRVVESSSDGGATWTRRLAHRADMLLAGSAPDLGTTWVVGARGTVFRRAVPGDWEKVTSPADATLVAVAAQDARRARVTAQDGRRFETNDGGATWSPVPE